MRVPSRIVAKRGRYELCLTPDLVFVQRRTRDGRHWITWRARRSAPGAVSRGWCVLVYADYNDKV